MFDSIKEYLKPELIWFLAGLLLLLLEFAAPGLIVFFFGVGACIVAIVCLVRFSHLLCGEKPIGNRFN